MFVLIDGNPTKEFNSKRGLRQCDLPSPFLFLHGCLKGYDIGNGSSQTLLQLVDDTILLCNGDHENMLAIEAILRGFEVGLGLKNNFAKSNVFELKWMISH